MPDFCADCASWHPVESICVEQVSDYEWVATVTYGTVKEGGK